jgi:ankyrin repeat protein
MSKLIDAINNCDFETAELLIKSKIDIDTVDEYGCTCLMMSSARGYIEIVKLLIAMDVNIDYQDRKNNNCSALIMAIRTNQYEIVKLLIAANASLELKDWFSHRTALMFAIKHNNYDIAKLLIDGGALIDRTTLRYAICKKNTKIIELIN